MFYSGNLIFLMEGINVYLRVNALVIIKLITVLKMSWFSMYSITK
jgi:hypothetical protein